MSENESVYKSKLFDRLLREPACLFSWKSIERKRLTIECDWDSKTFMPKVMESDREEMDSLLFSKVKLFIAAEPSGVSICFFCGREHERFLLLQENNPSDRQHSST